MNDLVLSVLLVLKTAFIFVLDKSNEDFIRFCKNDQIMKHYLGSHLIFLTLQAIVLSVMHIFMSCFFFLFLRTDQPISNTWLSFGILSV